MIPMRPMFTSGDGKIVATLRKSGMDFATEQASARARERKRTRDWSDEDIHNV